MEACVSGPSGSRSGRGWGGPGRWGTVRRRVPQRALEGASFSCFHRRAREDCLSRESYPSPRLRGGPRGPASVHAMKMRQCTRAGARTTTALPLPPGSRQCSLLPLRWRPPGLNVRTSRFGASLPYALPCSSSSAQWRVRAIYPVHQLLRVRAVELPKSSTTSNPSCSRTTYWRMHPGTVPLGPTESAVT